MYNINYDYYRIFYYVAKIRKHFSGRQNAHEQPAQSDPFHKKNLEGELRLHAVCALKPRYEADPLRGKALFPHQNCP